MIYRSRRRKELGRFRHQADRNKYVDQELRKITNEKAQYFKHFGQEWVTDRIWPPVRSAHDDGITSIEVIQEYGVFCTSSFDCTVKLWSFESPGQLVGRLILENNPDWNLRLNVR